MSGFESDLFAGLRVAVVGLGRNGFPVACALRDMGADVVAWDDSEPARTQAEAAGLSVAVPDMAGLSAMVLSPGIPHRLPAPHPLAAAAIAAGVPILSDAELLFRAVRASGSRARFAGITGTNGKSTTTALLAHILQAAGVPVAAGGNLGTPALSLPLLPHHGVYVLEMSSYMLERLATIRFDAAAMLNLSPDHLDRHGDMAGYVAAKREVFARQTDEDVAVVGIDDVLSREMAQSLLARPARVVTISTQNQLYEEMPYSLPGEINRQNRDAAMSITTALGIDETTAATAIMSFPGLAHRMETVGQIGRIEFVNDSKATNAESTFWALDAFRYCAWIAGGIAKAGGIDKLQPLLKCGFVKKAFLIGRDAHLIAETLGEQDVACEVVETLERAVPAAFACARQNDLSTVLLSPACASFDQFPNFEARGDRFRELVADLARAA